MPFTSYLFGTHGDTGLGPARPGSARLDPGPPRPDLTLNRKVHLAACRHTRIVFCIPPQRTHKTHTTSPQVGPGPLWPPGPTAPTRLGLARTVYVDSDESRLSWVIPIHSAPIDLVSWARDIPTNG